MLLRTLVLLTLGGLFWCGPLARAAEKEPWSGNWKGKGTVTEDSGEVSPCAMELAIDHSQQGDWEGLLVTGFPSCGYATAFLTTVVLEIRGSELMISGKPIGVYEGSSFQLLKYSNGFKEMIELMRSRDRLLVYRKRLTYQSQRKNFLIEGVLKPLR
ncbi:MAG: hypothetical protein NDJ90_11085 [Oligoflexia bacterium]|nr:hypothetical protein [Oligoflexia bacterium]